MWGMGHRGHVTRHSGGRCRDRGAIGPLFRQGSVLGRCRSVAPAAALLLAALLLAGLLLAAALLLAACWPLLPPLLPPPPPTWIRTTSIAGVWLARSIIGMRCEPSPAHTAHWAVPAWGSP